MRKFLLGAAAAATVLGATVAQAAPVSTAGLRSGAAVGTSEAAGGGAEWVLALLGVAGLVGILIAVNDENNPDDLPTSP